MRASGESDSTTRLPAGEGLTSSAAKATNWRIERPRLGRQLGERRGDAEQGSDAGGVVVGAVVDGVDAGRERGVAAAAEVVHVRAEDDPLSYLSLEQAGDVGGGGGDALDGGCSSEPLATAPDSRPPCGAVGGDGALLAEGLEEVGGAGGGHGERGQLEVVGLAVVGVQDGGVGLPEDEARRRRRSRAAMTFDCTRVLAGSR